MTEQKASILVATFSYGGSGATRSTHPLVGRYVGSLMYKLMHDPRIERVQDKDYSDTPITMTRNQAVKEAIDGGFDLLLMVDSDMDCDYMVREGHPLARPFMDIALEKVFADLSKPWIIAAPYCGPPPHESVYAFRWTSCATGIANECDMQLSAYERPEAAMMTGISEVGAAATGLMLLDVRLLKATDPRDQVQHLREKELLSKDEALARVKPWFYYEWTDACCSGKGSTEDVTFTRDISLYGVRNLGYNPVVVTWDAWAGHFKPHRVGKPMMISASTVGERLAMAVLRGNKENVRTQEIDFTASLPKSPTPPTVVSMLDSECDDDRRVRVKAARAKLHDEAVMDRLKHYKTDPGCFGRNAESVETLWCPACGKQKPLPTFGPLCEECLEKLSMLDRWMVVGGCNCEKCMIERFGNRPMMPLCEFCGNKRCPHALDHRYVCTKSNEPNQEPKVYEEFKDESLSKLDKTTQINRTEPSISEKWHKEYPLPEEQKKETWA